MKAAWFVMLSILAAASMAVALASPSLIGSAPQAVVTSRIGIARVAAVNNTGALTLNGFSLGPAGAYADVPASAQNIDLVGSDFFEWGFLAHVGDRAGVIVTLQNSGARGTVANLSCSVPPGLRFAMLVQPGYSTSGGNPIMRTSENAYSAFISGANGSSPAYAQFGMILEGLAPGQYQVSCTVSELGPSTG